MAQSIRNIVSGINDRLSGVFPGAVFNGVATLIEREGKAEPSVGHFDDSYSLVGYHRLIDIGVRYQSGFGDGLDTVNTFNNILVVFAKGNADEVAMIIQSVLSTKDINKVRIRPTRIILNSQTVYGTEYRGHDYAMSEEYGLMQINYTVEVTFKYGCPDLCPEDFSQCKSL